MKPYVVIDTNVMVSALLSKHADTATVLVMNAVTDGLITPLYHRDIIDEYDRVLHRKKFGFREENIRRFVDAVLKYGLAVTPTPTGEILPDADDQIFYEVTMEKRDEDARLVTGNLKHYPPRTFIVTPAEMLAILEENGILPASNP